MKTIMPRFLLGFVTLGTLILVFCISALPPLAADRAAADEKGAEEDGAEEGSSSKVEPGKPFGPPPGAKRLDPESSIWFDPKKKLVIIDGYVCLREGQLEMFACLQGTKEHESVVAVDTKAYYVHAALLAVGAKVGSPVQFDPKYKPATGTEIEVVVLWVDKEGKKQQALAQDWIRHAETKKPMGFPWVFAGSGFWFDEMSGKEHYQAEAGDLICVSNFPSATLDLPVESTQTNMGLLFEANTAQIPPLKTPIRLVLRPKLKPGEADEDAEKPAEEKKE